MNGPNNENQMTLRSGGDFQKCRKMIIHGIAVDQIIIKEGNGLNLPSSDKTPSEDCLNQV